MARYSGSGGHGRRITDDSIETVAKAARYYDPEHRRQRRLGAAQAGLAGGGAAAGTIGVRRTLRDSRKLGDVVVQSNPNPNARKILLRDHPAAKGALRLTKTNAALIAGGAAGLAGAGLVRQKAEGRKFGIWR